jgi:predicted enzyme related to lactoylglutathione lyase
MDSPRLMHVRVNVSDFARSAAWYESILGLSPRGHWPPEAPAYAHFDTGGAQFAISVEPVPAAGRFNFSVEDVDAWWESLRDRPDVVVVEPLFDTPYGTRKFTISDPDGNELGFVRDS